MDEDTNRNTKSRDRADEFIKDLAKMISDSLPGVNVFVVDSALVDKLCEVLTKDPTIRRKFSDQELYPEVSEFMRDNYVKPFRSENELRERSDAFCNGLVEEKQYEAVLLLDGLPDLPIGLRIGLMEIVIPDDKTSEVLNYLHSFNEKIEIYPQNCSWAKVQFTSFRTVGIQDILYKILELPFGVLSLMMMRDLDVRNASGLIFHGARRYEVSPSQHLGAGWSRYRDEYHGKYLRLLSQISQKQPSKLEKKILQGIQVFWLSRLSYKTELRFIMLVSAFESLLLTKNDRDYLGRKLAEKTAFLLGESYDDRIKTYRMMKDYYGKRSDLVHGRDVELTDTDELTLEGFFRGVTLKLLELSCNYDRMEQKSAENEREGVEDYINRLKFA
jgi:hypothetical protein